MSGCVYFKMMINVNVVLNCLLLPNALWINSHDILFNTHLLIFNVYFAVFACALISFSLGVDPGIYFGGPNQVLQRKLRVKPE